MTAMPRAVGLRQNAFPHIALWEYIVLKLSLSYLLRVLSRWNETFAPSQYQYWKGVHTFYRLMGSSKSWPKTAATFYRLTDLAKKASPGTEKTLSIWPTRFSYRKSFQWVKCFFQKNEKYKTFSNSHSLQLHFLSNFDKNWYRSWSWCILWAHRVGDLPIDVWSLNKKYHAEQSKSGVLLCHSLFFKWLYITARISS